MDEWVKKAFDFASDSTKQLITLSTAIITLTITFSKDVLQNVSNDTKETLTYSWIIYLISIFFGILTLLGLTGTLDPIPRKGSTATGGGGGGQADASRQPDKPTTPDKTTHDAAGGSGSVPAVSNPRPSIQGPNVRVFSALQILTFLAATSLVIKSGASAVHSISSSKNAGETVEQQVREIHRILLEALQRRDAAALEQYLASDCVLIGSLGQVLTRAQVTTSMNSAELSYESVNTDDVRFQLYGDTVVESGHAVIKGKYRDQDIAGQFRYSAVFINRQGNWQAISIQVARVDQTTAIQVSTRSIKVRPKSSGRHKRSKKSRLIRRKV